MKRHKRAEPKERRFYDLEDLNTVAPEGVYKLSENGVMRVVVLTKGPTRCIFFVGENIVEPIHCLSSMYYFSGEKMILEFE